MRTIKNQTPVHNTDYTKFPDGGVKNETDTNEGTPVVEEIYGDLFSNIYAYLRERGIVPNEIQDNQLNGYQLISALKRNVNELNDIERILVKNSVNSWSIDLDFSLVPDKYFIFARASESIDLSLENTITDSKGEVFPFTPSVSFNQADEVLLIIDKSSFVRAYPLSSEQSSDSDNNRLLFNLMDLPLYYSTVLDNEPIWYYDSGILFSDSFNSFDILSVVKRQFDINHEIQEVFKIGEKFIFVVFDTVNLAYKFLNCLVNDFENLKEFSLSGFGVAEGGDFNMFTYCDGKNLYFTNGANSVEDDFDVISAVINLDNNSLTFNFRVDLKISFQKSTNVVADAEKGLISFVNGFFKQFTFAGDSLDIGNGYPGNLGMIHKVNDSFYFTNGEVSKKINL